MPSPQTRSNVGSLAFTSLAHFINDGSVFFVPLVAAFLASAKGVSPPVVTAMLVLFYATSLVLSLFVGRWADRSGRPGLLIGFGLAVLSVGILGFFVALTFTSGAVLLVTIGVSAFLAGFGSTFYHPLGGTILQSAFDGRTRGRALGINGAAGSVGRALYPVLFLAAGVVLAGFDPLALFAVVGFAASVVIWVGLRERVAVRTQTAGNGKARDVATRGVAVLTLVVLVRSIATQGIASYIPIFLSVQKGLGTSSTLFIAVTTIYAPAVVGQPFFGWLVDRFDKRLVLALSTAGLALSVVAALSTEGTEAVVFLSLFGFFTFSGFPLFLSLVADYVPRNSSSLGNALVWGLGATGGSVIGPLVTGAIILTDYARLGLAFQALAVVALVSAVGTLFIPKAEKSGKVPLFG